MLETGLSESQQRTALKSLESLEVVSTKNKGVPAKKYYSLNVDNVEKLLENAWNAYKTQMLKNCTSRDAENSKSRVVENSNSSIYKNKDKKNKEKTPDEPVSLGTTHSRNFRKETEKLTDELSSGEEIKKQTATRKKQSKEEKCIEHIKSTTYSPDTQNLLIEYFKWNYHSDNVKKIKSLSDLKQKLSRLDQLIKQGFEAEKVVKCALDNQWYGFFEPVEKAEKKYDSPGVPSDGVISQTLHGDEVKEELARRTEVFI